MKKLLIFIAFCSLLSVYFFQKSKKNVFSQNEKLIEKENILINCLKQNVKNNLQSKMEISSNEMLQKNIQYIIDYKGGITDFLLCDKIFEVDSIIKLTNNKDSKVKIPFIGECCQKEIGAYNNELYSFFNSSIWIRNRLTKQGEILEKEYFEYKLNDLKPSIKRSKYNAELDSLMIEGIKKK